MSSKRKSARMFRVVSRYRRRIFLVINSSGQLPYTPPQGMWNHVKSCEIMWNHVKSCEIMWNHVKSCEIMWNYHAKLIETHWNIETLKPASECSLNAHGTVFLGGSTNPAGKKKVTLLSRSTRTFHDTSCHEKTCQACPYCKPELMSLVVASIGMVTQDISITTWRVDRRWTDGGQPSGEAEAIHVTSTSSHLRSPTGRLAFWSLRSCELVVFGGMRHQSCGDLLNYVTKAISCSLEVVVQILGGFPRIGMTIPSQINTNHAEKCQGISFLVQSSTQSIQGVHDLPRSASLWLFGGPKRDLKKHARYIYLNLLTTLHLPSPSAAWNRVLKCLSYMISCLATPIPLKPDKFIAEVSADRQTIATGRPLRSDWNEGMVLGQLVSDCALIKHGQWESQREGQRDKPGKRHPISHLFSRISYIFTPWMSGCQWDVNGFTDLICLVPCRPALLSLSEALAARRIEDERALVVVRTVRADEFGLSKLVVLPDKAMCSVSRYISSWVQLYMSMSTSMYVYIYIYIHIHVLFVYICIYIYMIRYLEYNPSGVLEKNA